MSDSVDLSSLPLSTVKEPPAGLSGGHLLRGKTHPAQPNCCPRTAWADSVTLFTRADPGQAAAVLSECLTPATSRRAGFSRGRPTRHHCRRLGGRGGRRHLGPAGSPGSTATAQYLGRRAELVVDVGVAGLHRILSRVELLREARVIVVAAGMDGALPSVVAGLVGAPVVAVPTSVGYGASFGGIAALLAMLNACAPGVAVVNIDNGYGAGHLAAQIAAPAADSAT